MDQLPIEAADRTLAPGDLNARINAGKLEVPQKLASLLRSQSIRTAAELVSYGAAFPSALAHLLGWSPTDVACAVSRLSNQLGDALPVNPTDGRYSFGAQDPSDLDPP